MEKLIRVRELAKVNISCISLFFRQESKKRRKKYIDRFLVRIRLLPLLLRNEILLKEWERKQRSLRIKMLRIN